MRQMEPFTKTNRLKTKIINKGEREYALYTCIYIEISRNMCIQCSCLIDDTKLHMRVITIKRILFYEYGVRVSGVVYR